MHAMELHRAAQTIAREPENRHPVLQAIRQSLARVKGQLLGERPVFLRAT
jgi:hypothetical protein